jgi:O-Antigen ligase
MSSLLGHAPTRLAIPALLAITGGTLFAFGGTPRWTTVPLAAGVALLVLAARPRVATSSVTRFLDISLLAALAAIALQLVPLPPLLRASIDPGGLAFDRAARVAGGTAAAVSAGAISVAPAATASALLVVVLTVLVFWSAREQFGRGGLRAAVRAIALMGLILAPLASAQHALEPRLLYWRWQPEAGNALPYTPFVNRNDFAAWLAMAIPVTLGYAVARLESRRMAGERDRLDAAVDGTGVLLGVSGLVMTAGLLAAMSRSALAGSAAGLMALVALARGRTGRRGAFLLVVLLVVLFGLAAAFVDVVALGTRMREVLSEGLAGRVAIWRQTWPMVRDFWPVGSGVGTYRLVMVLYQTSSRLFYISHADNEYLQILAEGGALLGVPVALAVAAGTVAIVRALRADRTPMYWVRAGAAGGIMAVAFQNVWEMTLRVPANGLMLALLAGIAMHDGSRRDTN